MKRGRTPKPKPSPRACVVCNAVEERGDGRVWATVRLQIDVPNERVYHFVGHTCSPGHLPGAIEQLAASARELAATHGDIIEEADMRFTAPGGDS